MLLPVQRGRAYTPHRLIITLLPFTWLCAHSVARSLSLSRSHSGRCLQYTIVRRCIRIEHIIAIKQSDCLNEFSYNVVYKFLPHTNMAKRWWGLLLFVYYMLCMCMCTLFTLRVWPSLTIHHSPYNMQWNNAILVLCILYAQRTTHCSESVTKVILIIFIYDNW